ncbi:glutaminase [Endozoicomonas sp. 2B-B]
MEWGKHLTADNSSPEVSVKKFTVFTLAIINGDWAFLVGLPDKSGVGGGVVAVVPGKMAIAGFSPPLDEAGNSVRAMKMISHIANSLDLSIYCPS